jgi:hypothetical protein
MSNDTVTVPLGNTVVDLGNCGAGRPTYNYTVGGAGSGDVITIDKSLYSSGSITSPQVISWDPSWTTTTGTSYTITPPSVSIDTTGINIKDGGDIKVGGKSLSDAIEKIEERLGILHPNPKLEDRWEQLKEIRKQYIELEKDLLEKEKLMKILKDK